MLPLTQHHPQLLVPALPTRYVTSTQQVGTQQDDLDNLLHKRLNAGLSTFCIAQALLLVSNLLAASTE